MRSEPSASSAAWLLLISRYYQWFGGGSWGPRFLVPLLPLWILPAAEVFKTLVVLPPEPGKAVSGRGNARAHGSLRSLGE